MCWHWSGYGDAMTAILVLLLLAAQSDEPPPPADVAAAAAALSSCIGARVEDAPVAGDPEATADSILAACATQIDEGVAAHRRWVEGSALSEREKAEALSAMAASLDELRRQLTEALRDGRQD